MGQHLSDSLAATQAIRFGAGFDWAPDTFGMETNADRRRRKLRALVLEKGGYAAVAGPSCLSAQSLEQVVKGTLLPPKKGSGTREPRNLGDSSARAIEGAFGLERGWFDNDDRTDDMSASELLLLGYFRLLDDKMQNIVIENVRDAAERRAALAEALTGALRPNRQTASPG